MGGYETLHLYKVATNMPVLQFVYLYNTNMQIQNYPWLVPNRRIAQYSILYILKTIHWSSHQQLKVTKQSSVFRTLPGEHISALVVYILYLPNGDNARYRYLYGDLLDRDLLIVAGCTCTTCNVIYKRHIFHQDVLCGCFQRQTVKDIKRSR